jgi:hypothetical protein
VKLHQSPSTFVPIFSGPRKSQHLNSQFGKFLDTLRDEFTVAVNTDHMGSASREFPRLIPNAATQVEDGSSK